LFLRKASAECRFLPSPADRTPKLGRLQPIQPLFLPAAPEGPLIIENLHNLDPGEDFPDLLPGHGPDFRSVRDAMDAQEFPHVEVQASFYVGIKTGDDGLQYGTPELLITSDARALSVSLKWIPRDIIIT
jgi:hypothetical protein